MNGKTQLVPLSVLHCLGRFGDTEEDRKSGDDPQLSIWLQFLHSGGVPEQLPPPYLGEKQIPDAGPALGGPTYLTEHPPSDLQE